jgi:carboxyl-terminal processing protease
MMEAHVSCKEISPLLVKRALENYIEELDPAKLYLLEEETHMWLNPSQALLEQITHCVKRGDFSHFSTIHALMVAAISRRHNLEKALSTSAIPLDVSVADLKILPWAKNVEELTTRYLQIKALQISAAKKLDSDTQDTILRRIAKNRSIHEEDICSPNLTHKEQLILSNVLKAFASSCDTHTSYFTPGEAAQFVIQVQQRLFGIGAQLRDDLNGFTVVKIIEGGPASRDTGLKVNDRIIAVNGEPIVGLDIMRAVEWIRGAEGTAVTLTILRQGTNGEEKHEINIMRGEVVIQDSRIESHLLPYGNGMIAHIALHAFYQDPQHSSSSDLFEEINKIQREHNLKGIILDLRSNAGGLLPQAIAVTGLFITKGIVCSIKDNNGLIEHLRDLDGKTVYDGPLLILTNKASASASEIVAQTLQDYGRAIIVGDEHTYGKGTFQTFTLDNEGKINPKGEFKVTRGKYYTVSGKSPQLIGVKPDIIVPGVYAKAEIGEKHAKHPLENDSITENFTDDLSDIPPPQREQISWLYRFNLQPKLKSFTRHLDVLQKNSANRIGQDPFYQNFLALLDGGELEPEQAEPYLKSDPQLTEAMNVIKDLILLLK